MTRQIFIETIKQSRSQHSPRSIIYLEAYREEEDMTQWTYDTALSMHPSIVIHFLIELNKIGAIKKGELKRRETIFFFLPPAEAQRRCYLL